MIAWILVEEAGVHYRVKCDLKSDYRKQELGVF